jgi:hypothetical protein
MSKILFIGASTGIAVTLFGCGGGDDSTTSTTNADSTTTSAGSATTTPVPTGLICNADADKCAADLNVHYNGFDEKDEKSAMGVAIRGRARFDENAQWFFCTGKCFQQNNSAPYPDCYTAAGLINHKIMQTEGGQIPSASNSKSASDAFFARYPVLLVFQPENALTRFTKCAWQFDGSAFTRSNGGCGMGASGQTCKEPTSAYNDKCVDDPTKWADETCATTMTAYCDEQTPGYSTNCFWKGPAWASPVNPGAKPDFDYSDFDQNNEIRKMLVNRLGHQDGETSDKLPLLEYWDEITMDGRIIQHFIDTDGIASVLAAIAFTKGNSDAIDQVSQVEAQKFVDYYSKQSKVNLPLLALDTAWKIGSDGGPFTVVKPKAAVTV